MPSAAAMSRAAGDGRLCGCGRPRHPLAPSPPPARTAARCSRDRCGSAHANSITTRTIEEVHNRCGIRWAAAAHCARMHVTPRRLALGMSLWAPNLFSGIRVKRFAEDWTSADRRAPRQPDHPQLRQDGVRRVDVGDDRSVLLHARDAPARPRLRRVGHPGRDRVRQAWPGRAHRALRGAAARRREELRERARGGAKVLEWFETEITDAAGEVVARVQPRGLRAREAAGHRSPPGADGRRALCGGGRFGA